MKNQGTKNQKWDTKMQRRKIDGEYSPRYWHLFQLLITLELWILMSIF